MKPLSYTAIILNYISYFFLLLITDTVSMAALATVSTINAIMPESMATSHQGIAGDDLRITDIHRMAVYYAVYYMLGCKPASRNYGRIIFETGKRIHTGAGTIHRS